MRTDFNIEIDFDLERPLGKEAWEKRGRWIRGRIRYFRANPPSADGVLLYGKPVVRGREPIDVTNYVAENPHFPHQSTTDQWFNEAQFESYRILGLITANDLEPLLNDGPNPTSVS